MPSTFTQTETFPKGTERSVVETEQTLRIKAGAITSEISGSKEKGWTLTTTWNVIGEQ